nr:RNA-directed DNA polymerase, eukaryota [Tanacetum cinerariifolium]
FQETKMTRVSDMDVKFLCGNSNYDFVCSDSLGSSGGILCICIWEALVFKKDNVTLSDNFIAIYGTWLPSNSKILFDDMIKLSWHSFSHSDINGMIRLKKLQDLKNIIHRWVKAKRQEVSGFSMEWINRIKKSLRLLGIRFGISFLKTDLYGTSEASEAFKLNAPIEISFCRNARGGLEQHLMEDMNSMMGSVVLLNSSDRWAVPTRWVKYIPIKHVLRHICRWWGLDPNGWTPFQEWQAWLLSIRFSSKLKLCWRAFSLWLGGVFGALEIVPFLRIPLLDVRRFLMI